MTYRPHTLIELSDSNGNGTGQYIGSTAMPISGTVTAINSSVGADLDSAPVFSTKIGAIDHSTGILRPIHSHEVFGYSVIHTTGMEHQVHECYDGDLYGFNDELNLPSSSTETNIVLIKNPSSSGLLASFYRFIMDCITKGGQATFRFYTNPTVTSNGTAVSIGNRHIGHANTSSIQVFKSPVTSSAGAKFITLSVGKDSNSFYFPLQGSIILAQNNSLLITGQPEANNRIVSLSAAWAEEGL